MQELSLRLKSLAHFQSVKITAVLPLSVGGNEGAKFTCKVVLKRSKTTLDCIIKSYLYRWNWKYPIILVTEKDGEG